MIILYESNEKNFTTLGLGVLSDATFASVIEELNGGFELEMEYPVDGNHFKDISLQKILYTKPNAYDPPQPFRIYKITKPLHGLVTINAEHISYDAAGYTIRPFSAESLIESINKIQNGSIRNTPFIIDTNFDEAISMATKSPYNMRTLLAGGGDSILDIYGGYYKFDKFNINLLKNRGYDRGVVLRYGKNLTELDQEINSEKMYTGIYPFYSSVNTETKTFMERYHQEVYIVPEVIPQTSGWLKLKNEMLAFIPIVETFPVQIKTEGAYYDQVYWFKKQTPTDVEIVGNTPMTADWLSLEENGVVLVPEELTIYKVKTVGDYEYEKYIWDGSSYITYDGNGFYHIPDPIPDPLLVRNTVETLQVEEYVDLTTAIDRYTIEGSTELAIDWLSDSIGGEPVLPEINTIYLVKSGGVTTTYTVSHSPIVATDTGNSVIVEVTVFLEHGALSPVDKSINVGISYREGVNLSPKVDNLYGVLLSGQNSVTLTKTYEYVEGYPIFEVTLSSYFPTSFEHTVMPEGDGYKYKWDDVAQSYVKLLDEKYYTNGIIYLDQTAEFQNILTLDLTSEFNREKPTVEQLEAKAIEYLDKNDITKTTNSTTVSFIKLADSPEYERYSELETVELGDTVKVIYEELGVESSLQVIRTEFNVINEKYNEIELGEKEKGIADNAITRGDSVSALVNDKRYTDQASVKAFIAETITADYIQAKNANLSAAQIDDLKTMKINVSGLIEASTAAIDSLVANLLVAENAEIMNQLVAGDIRLRGDMVMDSGAITIMKQQELESVDAFIVDTDNPFQSTWLSLTEGGVPLTPVPDDIYTVKTAGIYYDLQYKWDESFGYFYRASEYVFEVDRSGNVTANSMRITGGSINIGENFRVTNEGIVTAKGVNIINGEIDIDYDYGKTFKVDQYGVVTAQAIHITQAFAEEINATEIESDKVTVNKLFLNDENVSIERVTDVTSESHTYTVSAVAMGTYFGDIFNISLGVTASEPVYYDRIFSVSTKYKDSNDNIHMLSRDVTILAGDSGGNVTVEIGTGEYSLGYSTVVFPDTVTETRNSGGNDKVIIKVFGTEYDIISGIMDPAEQFIVQETQPDTTDLLDNTIWFDVDEEEPL